MSQSRPVRALVIGRSGQLARALAAVSDASVLFRCLGRGDGLDATRADQLVAALRSEQPDLVVNAAAYTAVDMAESEPDLAFALNCESPRLLARLCAEEDIPLIHISTDYVFDGEKNDAYVETDPVRPLNVYGASKAAGEAAVREATQMHLILRTSWLYSRFGGNFVATMLNLATREELRIVADQRGCPTAAEDVAEAIKAIIRRLEEGVVDPFGTFHLAGQGTASWFEFAQAIFELRTTAGRRGPRLTAIATSDYPTAARRPMNSTLDCSKVARTYGIALPPWRQSLATVLREMASERSPS